MKTKIAENAIQPLSRNDSQISQYTSSSSSTQKRAQLKTDNGNNIIINTANGNNNIINININGKPASAEDESNTPQVEVQSKRCHSESIEDRLDTDRPLLDEDEDDSSEGVRLRNYF